MDAAVTRRVILFSQIGLATERFRAIDLSCRACGAGAWALGLDSRLGDSATLRFPPPTSLSSLLDLIGISGSMNSFDSGAIFLGRSGQDLSRNTLIVSVYAF